MIAYFIGGERDLSKQRLPDNFAPRELVNAATLAAGAEYVTSEYYRLLGAVPGMPDTFVYAHFWDEKLKLRTTGELG